jgi:anti-sigma-K factor RskA
MPHSDRHEELASLQVLGLLGPEEAGELDRHLEAGCRVCEDLSVELKQSAAALAATVPSRRAPPRVRERILASLGPARPLDRPARAKPRPLLWVAAAAVLLAVLLFDDWRLRREREDLSGQAADLASRIEKKDAELARRDLRARVLESEDVRLLFLGGKDPQPRARAKVFWSEKAKRGFVVAANLEPLPAGRQYQLWVFDKGKPVDAGVFDADEAGRALFESKDLSAIASAENFAVTVEPQGGVPQPTGPIVLIGVS